MEKIKQNMETHGKLKRFEGSQFQETNLFISNFNISGVDNRL